MTRIVRIRGDAAVYPAGACVSCLRPATRQVELVKVKRHAVRKIYVPFCHECLALRQFKSSRQVLLRRVGTASSVFLALVVGLYAYGRTSAAGVWAVLLGALSALVVFGVAYLLVEPLSRRFQSDATAEALRAVTIRDFDWETTTLEFADDEYADQFARANGGQFGWDVGQV
jgi:hypothetical protein